MGLVVKRIIISFIFVSLIAFSIQSNLIAAPGNAKPSQKQILFTQTTETPVDGGSSPTACPNSAHSFAAFCPIGTVLVSGQCAIDPPIPHLPGTPNFINLKAEIDPDLDTENEHGVDVGSAAHLQCVFKCQITDTNQPIPAVPDDAVIIATILCAGTPIE